MFEPHLQAGQPWPGPELAATSRPGGYCTGPGNAPQPPSPPPNHSTRCYSSNAPAPLSFHSKFEQAKYKALPPKYKAPGSAAFWPWTPTSQDPPANRAQRFRNPIMTQQFLSSLKVDLPTELRGALKVECIKTNVYYTAE